MAFEFILPQDNFPVDAQVLISGAIDYNPTAYFSTEIEFGGGQFMAAMIRAFTILDNLNKAPIPNAPDGGFKYAIVEWDFIQCDTTSGTLTSGHIVGIMQDLKNISTIAKGQ